MFHLFFDLFQLFISQFNHFLLFLDFLDCFFEISLDLIQPRELLLYLVLLSCHILHFFHELGILFVEGLKVSLKFAELPLCCQTFRLIVNDRVLSLDELLPQGIELISEDYN